MRIALYSPSWPGEGSANGIVTYASELVPALRRLGHEVFVLTGHPSPSADSEYVIDLRRFASEANLMSRAMWRLSPARAGFNEMTGPLVRAAQSIPGLDVIEIEESFGWSAALSKVDIAPVVVRLHGPWFLNGRHSQVDSRNRLNKNRERMERRGITSASLVTSPSAAMLRETNVRYRLKLDMANVIPNSIKPPDGSAWSDNDCNNSILFVGRFDRLKGADVVLRAFSSLAHSRHDLTLTFVGPDCGIKSSGGTIQSFDEFTRYSIPQTIRNRISFLGQISRDSVAELRSRHSVTVIASRQEMMPYSALEAMSAGCPIVATNAGGIPEIIKDRHNGIIVPTENSASMAEAIGELLDNKRLAASLGEQARLDCGSFFSSDAIAKRTSAAYKQAMLQ